jgi:hypothetical protein
MVEFTVAKWLSNIEIKKMTEYYINEEWLSTVANKKWFSTILKMTESSVVKMTDKITKWLNKMVEFHYSKMTEFTVPEWLSTL